MGIILGIEVLVIIIIIWIYYIYLCHPDYNIYEYNEIKHKFKTGDIILFHALDNINPIFIGTYYGHIGIVYYDDDIPYIFEAFNPETMPFYPKEYEKGIILSQLETRIKSYRGYCFYKELEISLDEKCCNELKSFILFALNNMYYDVNVIQNGMNKILFNDTLNTGTNCGELVYLSLIKLGLLPTDYLYYNNKHHLLWLSNLIEVQNNKYKEPVYVLSNYFVS